MPLGTSTREGREAGARAGRSGDTGGAGETRGSTAAQRRGVSRTGAREDVGGAFGTFAGEDPTTGTAEFARSIDQRSALKQFVDRVGANLFGKIEGIAEKLTSPEAIGTGIGFVLGGVPGARIGGLAGSLVSDPSAPTAQAQAAPTVAQAAPSVTPQDISAQRQFTNIGQLGGDGGQVATAPTPVSRVSGVQPQQPQLAALGQQLPQQRFLNQGGVLPTVNLGAFPGALGRT